MHDCAWQAKVAPRIVKRLRDVGRTVHLINPRDTSGQCYASLSKAIVDGAKIDAVNLVISPLVGRDVVEDMWRLGIRYLFVQPGADADFVLQRGRELGLEVQTGCVLVDHISPL